LIAGATDIGLWVTKQDRPLLETIHLARVDTLREFAFAPAGAQSTYWLGASMTHAEAARCLAEPSPVLAELWRRFAGLQVRSAGTIGGNIANGSPIGDLAPALIAAGTILHLRRGHERRDIPLEDFFVDYGKQDRRAGEFIRGLEVPAFSIRSPELAVYKVSKRFDDDISAVCGAFWIAVEGGVVTHARIAYGGMAAVPKRACAMEAALVGRTWTRATVERAMAAAAQDFKPISDARASAAYRLVVAQNLLLRAFLARTDPGAVPSLAGSAADSLGVI
jgi:xanthine dehydrogenase small subunit